MAVNLLLAGQSQLSRFTAGDIAALANTLSALTGKSVNVIQAAVGGSALTKAAVQAVMPHAYWTNKTDSDSPLCAVLSTVPMVDVVAFAQGEQDGFVGIDEDAYFAGLLELRAIITAKYGKNVPLVVAPLGYAASLYTSAWMVRNAHIKIAFEQGFSSGPEYIDLARDPADNIHLTDAARGIWVQRWASKLAPVVSAQYGPAPYSGSFTRDISLASGQQTITGLPFTPTKVTLSAALAGIYTSTGSDNGSVASCSYMDGANGGSRTDASVYIYAASSGNGYKGHVSAFGSGYFVMDWTKIASGGGTAAINFTVYP